MTKIVLDTVSSGYNLGKINANFEKIEDQLNDKVLYRDNTDTPTEPNELEQDLDLNSNRILNLPVPTSPTEPLRYGDITSDETGATVQYVDESIVVAVDEATNTTVPLNIINDLSQSYEFPTVAAYKSFETVFPVGKVINILERNASFTVISGVGTATERKIIASTQVDQSADLIVGFTANSVAFGVVGDDEADESIGIDEMVLTGLPVHFENKKYRYGSYASPKQLVLPNEKQSIFLNGGELGTPLGSISVEANDVTIDLGGGTLSGMTRYAEFDETTTVGQQTFNVVSAEFLEVGQEVASSWGDTAGSAEYPMGGPIGNPKKTITDITGNAVTLNIPLSGSVQTMQKGVVFGEYLFTGFLFNKNSNLVVRNGHIERCRGYYYRSPDTINETHGDVKFLDIHFDSNGLDQMLLKHNQNIYLTRCTMAQQWDYAKSGIWFDGSSSVYIDHCDLSLGNFDSAFNFRGTFSQIASGELKISHSTIRGTNILPNPPAASFGVDVLFGIETEFEGAFDSISISDSEFIDFSRHLISSGQDNTGNSTSIRKISVSKSKIGCSFGYFIYDGAGALLNCPSVTVNNTDFTQDGGYVLYNMAAINGAVSTFKPIMNDCKFEVTTATFGNFSGPILLENNTISNTAFTYSGTEEMYNTTFNNGSTIAVSPTYDSRFGGYLGKIIIDDESFPHAVGDIVTVFSGSTANGLKVASAKSPRGSVYYDLFKSGTVVRVSGGFHKAGNLYDYRGDDWYIPKGSVIRDLFLGDKALVSANVISLLTADAASGSTSITVDSSAGVNVSDLINILLDDDVVHTATVSTVPDATTITFTPGTDGDASIGRHVNAMTTTAI